MKQRYLTIAALLFYAVPSIAGPFGILDKSESADLKVAFTKESDFRIDWAYNGIIKGDYINTTINSSLLNWAIFPQDSSFYHSINYCAALFAGGAFIAGVFIDYAINDSLKTARRMGYAALAPLLIANSRIAVSSTKLPWFEIYAGTTGDICNWSDGDITPKISEIKFQYNAVAGLNLVIKPLIINTYIQKPMINPTGLPSTSIVFSIGLRTIPPSV